MIHREIHVHSDLDALSRAVANRFVEWAGDQMALTGRFTVALSGGSTPQRLYQLLGSLSYAPQIDWGRVQLFQVDERCVPPSHGSSNFRMIRETMLVPASIPANSFHRVEGELAADIAANEYAKDLEKTFPVHPPEFPRFDLVFLGMGADGHVASLFPGSQNLNERTRWVVPSERGPEGLERVTLTLPVLNAAAHIIFLVSGAEKSETLARVLGSPDAPGSLPVQFINPSAGTICWHLDEASASKLKSRSTT